MTTTSPLVPNASSPSSVTLAGIFTFLIPLSAKASRGDQILNANSFAKQGFSMVMEEETVTTETLVAAVRKLREDSASYVKAMEENKSRDAIAVITELIEENRLKRD